MVDLGFLELEDNPRYPSNLGPESQPNDEMHSTNEIKLGGQPPPSTWLSTPCDSFASVMQLEPATHILKTCCGAQIQLASLGAER